MRFLMLYRPADTSSEQGLPPSADHVAEMGKYIEQLTREGTLLYTEGCQPSSKGARVRTTGAKTSVTDGPFSEAKEVIGGFAIINAGSKAEAIEHAKRFMKVAGDGEVEVRVLHDAPPPMPAKGA
jgi:hypothetical protein